MENQWSREHWLDAPEKKQNRSIEIRSSENTKEQRQTRKRKRWTKRMPWM